MSVKCNYEGLSFRRSFCRPVVYDNLDDLMSENLNKKPNLKCIDEYWVKKAVKKANLQKDGFTLNQNSDVHIDMPIIKYEPVLVDIATPGDICKNTVATTKLRDCM